MKKQNKNKSQKLPENNIVLYSDKHGNIELRADVDKDTIWATLEQVARLFDTQRPAITKHFRNIFRTKELKESSVCSILEHTGSDSKIYQVKFYNLDAIIAVGYRVNSKKATQFRIWATGIPRDYLVTGHALNKHTLVSSTEKIQGLHEAVALLESSKHPGKVRGRLTLKVTKEMVERE